MRSALSAVCLAACLVATTPATAAPPPPKTRTHIDVTTVENAPDAPPALADRVKATLATLIATRPELSAKLDGAPDPGDPAAYRAFLKAHKLRVFSVAVKITEFSRAVGPNPKGKGGQVLTVHLALSLLGDVVPDGTMGLAGAGGATIAAEVGAVPSATDEESTLSDVINDALTQALDQAVAKLDAPAAKTPAKKKPAKPTRKAP